MNKDDKRRRELLRVPTPADMSYADVKWVLEDDGWTERSGKGDHINFTKPGEDRIGFDTDGKRKVNRFYLKQNAKRVRQPGE